MEIEDAQKSRDRFGTEKDLLNKRKTVACEELVLDYRIAALKAKKAKVGP